MTTTKQAVDAIARRIGLPIKRVRAVGVALSEAGLLPAGSPGKSPQLDPEHVVSLLIGSCLDVPLRAVADSVRTYRAMTLGGADLSGLPSASIYFDAAGSHGDVPERPSKQVLASIRTAGDHLDIWADIAVNGDSDILRRDKIEIVSSWPEVALIEASGTKRWQPVGSLPNHWQSTGHRRSTTINGAAFVDALRELFGEK